MMFYKRYEVLYAALLAFASWIMLAFVIALIVRSMAADTQWYGGQIVAPAMVIGMIVLAVMATVPFVWVMLKRRYLKGAWQRARQNTKLNGGKDSFTQVDGVRVDVTQPDATIPRFQVSMVGSDAKICFKGELQRDGLSSDTGRAITMKFARSLHRAMSGHAMSLA